MSEENLPPVAVIVDRLKVALDCRTDTDLGKFFGSGQSLIGNWRSRGTMDYGRVIAVCRERGISLDYLFAPESARTDSPPPRQFEVEEEEELEEFGEEDLPEILRRVARAQREMQEIRQALERQQRK